MCPTGIFSASQSVNVVFGSAVRRSADKSVYDFSIFNIFSILAVCLMVYFQCRIMLVNGGKKISALFLAACVVTSYSVLWALNFRPDTFMYLCLFAGILCLCRYVREKALWLLVMSFLCFFLAFMFTQKVLLNLIVPGSFVLYWLLKGNIGGKDFYRHAFCLCCFCRICRIFVL